MPSDEPSPQVGDGLPGPVLPLAHANRIVRNDAFRGVYSPGTATEESPDGHDGGMAGLEGFEQPRGHGRVAAARWSPAVEDERALKALELFGNPTEAEVPLPSRPESAATARRLTQVVVLRQWQLTPKMTEEAVLLVSELVGNAVRHTGARVFGLRLRRRRGWIRVEVRDPSRGLPCLMPVQEMDISGRGLFLVDKLADRWGVDLLPRGKTTWFEMRVADR
ncbi:non-specific serine/threonine protein kinase OS=Streptomyces aurantiogriseus OX=66870 GN=GCM10010251_36630 PE=3 SV=1 [Streptomyces aurantiogriseus]|uniref:ATP-binding protein n=2 Tax=Streptomyces aurantiogriseus TaxID=66870 RepID=A0A918CBQ3_9ACTN|nr:ATP-binding protein [Streptomyces aurantiogriseus]